MALSSSILALNKPQQEQEEVQQPQSSWVQNLIDARYQPKTERIKRTPIGFEFKRDPFDPSSYYNELGSLRDVSRLATQVTNVEVANKEEADRQREEAANQAAIQDALKGVNPNFDTLGSQIGGIAAGVSRKYKLKGVSPITGQAADFFGSKYGIKTVYGLGKGSVPGSDHPKGRAIDLMINNIKHGTATGTAMANDIIKNYKAWNVKYVIWNRYIWHPGRGWSKYSGPSPHTDHVHVSFNK